MPHAAFGFLEWKAPHERDTSFAPLVLLPVDIEKKRTREGLEFWVNGRGEEAETNLVFAEKLKLDFGIDLPRFEGGSIEEYLAQVKEASPPALDFKVRRQVVFGVFPSARMAMYYDLDPNKNSFEENDVLKNLMVGSASEVSSPFADEYEIDAPEIEKKVPNIVMDADSSQHSTLVDIADGSNVAVEGPPGTGKSQTIVNAIATALASGKKVLFVAEKMAALDVVRARLESVGLGEFILPLQAERATREKVIQSVRERVGLAPRNNEQELERKTAQFKAARSEIADYIAVITSEFGNAGLTVHDILGRSIATASVLLDKPKKIRSLDIQGVENFSRPQIDQIFEVAKRVELSWKTTETAAPFWRELKVRDVDRFAVESLCENASDAAAAFENADVARSAVAAFGVESKSSIFELQALLPAFRIEAVSCRVHAHLDIGLRRCGRKSASGSARRRWSASMMPPGVMGLLAPARQNICSAASCRREPDGAAPPHQARADRATRPCWTPWSFFAPPTDCSPNIPLPCRQRWKTTCGCCVEPR